MNSLAGIIEKLLIYPENMLANLNRLKGLIFSQRVMLALVDAGMKREEAYNLTQRNAMKVWAGEGSFKDLLESDADVMRALSVERLEALFDTGFYTAQIDFIFKKVFREI